MNQSHIRKATQADLPRIADVFIEARTRCLPYLNWEYSHDVMVAVFTRRMRDLECWVAEQDGSVVGFITFGPDEIDDLYVLPDFHGQGLGSALLDKAIDATEGDLRLWVFQQNTQARRFYEQHGFVLEFETDGKDNMEKTPDARYVRGRSTSTKLS